MRIERVVSGLISEEVMILTARVVEHEVMLLEMRLPSFFLIEDLESVIYWTHGSSVTLLHVVCGMLIRVEAVLMVSVSYVI